jgi:phosphoglycolate phosphatase
LFDKMEKDMTVCFARCPVVFDLDGTLIDSAPDIHACVNAALGLHRIEALSLDEVRSFVGGGVDVLWSRVAAARHIGPARLPELKSAFMSRYENATTHTRLYPGVRNALETLADRTHPLGICTNKPLAPTLHILEHFKIRHLFGSIIGGDSLPFRKPDPAPLRACLAELGSDPLHPRAIYVGDSEYDAACATATGVPFLLFTGGYRQKPVSELPHRDSFDDFVNLPRLIDAEALA